MVHPFFRGRSHQPHTIHREEQEHDLFQLARFSQCRVQNLAQNKFRFRRIHGMSRACRVSKSRTKIQNFQFLTRFIFYIFKNTDSKTGHFQTAFKTNSWKREIINDSLTKQNWPIRNEAVSSDWSIQNARYCCLSSCLFVCLLSWFL